MWSSEVALVHLFLQNPYPSYPILRIFLKGVGTNNDHYYYFNHYEFEICGKKNVAMVPPLRFAFVFGLVCLFFWVLMLLHA